MKRIYSYMLCAIAAMVTVSCSKEIQNEQPVQETNLFPMTITATSTDTKTELVDRVSIKWLSTDELSVFDGEGNQKFTSNGEGKTVTFSGNAAEAETYYALYPYNAEANLTGATVTTTLASEQQAKAGSFADGLNINASKAAATEDFHFTNVLSVAKVSVAATNLDGHTIKSVKLSSNYALAGDITVSYGETITAAAGTNAVKEITLEGGESGLSDGDYYFCLLPNDGGEITLTFTDTEGNTAIKTASLGKPFTAGSIKNLGTVKGLVWTAAEKYFVKVTSNNELGDGQYLMVYSDGENFITLSGISETSTKYGLGETITSAYSEEKNGFASSKVSDYVLDIQKVGTSYTIKASFGYLWWGSGNSLNANEDIQIDGNINKSLWTISFEEELTIKSAWASDRGIRYNTSSPRFACYTSGQSAVSLYKLEDDRPAIATPTNLQVNDMTLSWDAVSNASNYSVIIGEVSATVEGTSYTFEGEADYYNVSVVANPADPTNYKSSAAATLTGATLGTPTLRTPDLAEGVIDETSIQVTWTPDPRATAGYVASISKDGVTVETKTINSGAVTFTSLTNGSEYVISVYAVAVTGEKPYAPSESTSITLSTAAKKTISTIFDKGAGSYVITDVTVLAVKANALILGDDTGKIYAYKSNHGLKVGDVVTVNGEATMHNEVFEFDSPNFTKQTSTTVNHGTAVEISTGYASLQSDFINANNIHTAVYVHGIGMQDGRNITIGNTALYLSANESATDQKQVEVYGYVYAYSTTHSNFNFVVTSIEEYIDPNAPTMDIDPESLALSWTAAESGSEKAKTITVTLNEAASGYNVSYTDADNAWTVSDNESGTITVYPNAANSSTTADKVLNITISHKDDNSLSSTIILKQQKKSNGGTYSLTPNQESTGSSATTYITTLTEFTYNGISWKMNQWNPSSLQIKTNQSSPAAQFRFYNTSAFSGRIAKVVIKFSALTVSDAAKLMFVGGTSEVDTTTGGTAGVWDSSTKTLTWTPSSSENFTYFAFYQNGKAASGTNKLAETDAIVVIYE